MYGEASEVLVAEHTILGERRREKVGEGREPPFELIWHRWCPFWLSEMEWLSTCTPGEMNVCASSSSSSSKRGVRGSENAVRF